MQRQALLLHETRQCAYVLFMSTSRESFEFFRLFQRVVPPWFLRELCQKHEYCFRQGVYNAGVVLWLMIWQRLQGNRSLEAAVQYLLQGGGGGLQIECKRWDDDNVSTATGSYCMARQRLPLTIVRGVTERMMEQLRTEMQEGWEGLQRPVFVIDGSSLQLRYTPELVKAYPPGHNQHGENHWPVLRIIVMHDAFSGLALAPSWGPFYGSAAVSEQALAEAALESLPAEAVVLGDGNFGIFSFAYAVQQSGRPMTLRLTQARAQKILGQDLKAGTDQRVVWRPSRWDRAAHPQLPDQALVEGRVVVCRNPARADELLYLFTTLELPAEKILGIYKLRWRVETDLRSLKRTVGLHQLSSKSRDMVDKELLLAVAAYNLVRAVMCLAARRANIEPRQLSFSFVQAVVEAALPGLDHASTDEEYAQRMERMLRYASQRKLPRRKRQRSYPREVWGRGGHFPSRKRNAENEAQPQ
jgi:hypothetical protein